ncbi:hypothetical protein SCLARK_001803 [Spiroplasma clarkii]|uniref:adenylyltransferase/cytidyltransferase family protein n=1 Tax=Spiroplasma clarkii TaxID=2139 RepID=UPI000B568352|nr:adenylyltransferase/cytidyltransferase family protein [Spiroplasma clarkii]ARU92248.1 hypothetical protein SCLARK_001803 [Spiroplasma clarkii]
MIQSLEYKDKTAFIVLNANPLTLGHLYLIKTAASENEHVYLIPVAEDNSFFTYAERTKIIKANINEFENVTLLPGTEYLISKNFFPSYFLQSNLQAIKEQSNLDANLFCDLLEGKKTSLAMLVMNLFQKLQNYTMKLYIKF